MVELTGKKRGTSKADVYEGSIIGVDQVDASSSGGGILDRFEGIVAKDLKLKALGGNDVLKATLKFAVESTELSPPAITSTGIGIESSNINMGGGKDTLDITSKVTSINLSRSLGLSESVVNMRSGDDVIKVNALAKYVNVGYSAGVSSIGVANSTLSAGGGNDRIDIVSTVRAEPLPGRSGSLSSGLSVFGLDSATVKGNGGNDTINISSVVNLDPAVNGGGIARPPRGAGIDYGSKVLGGSGNDNINIDVDVISLNQSSTGPEAFYGVRTSEVHGGSGNDSISINVKRNTLPTSSRRLVGVLASTVTGGAGNDTLYVRGVSIDIDDALLKGGSGKDTFNTGIGQASIDGGKGTDLIRLNFFDSKTMDISLLDEDSIQITGTQDKLGNSDSWTQTITSVEQYSFGGSVYSAADVVSMLS